jgi:hypothetical protein
MTEQGVIRVNVSVPKALKARMDRVADQANWSSVATAAFEAKVLELESQQEVESMEDVIARLKAADELDHSQSYQDGREAGRLWARNAAWPKHLRRLEAMQNHPEYDTEWMLAEWVSPLNPGIAVCLYRRVAGVGEDTYDAAAMRAFWAAVLGPGGAEKIDDPAFARGFVEEAVEVWEQVRDAF